MRFVKPSSNTPVIVKGREGDADVANKACLRSDLAKDWGRCEHCPVADGVEVK